MTVKPYTMLERVARLETLIEEKVVGGIDKLEDKVDQLVSKVDDDVADLARLKHRGAGILVGVSLAFTVLGALMRPVLDSLKGFFH